MTCDWCGHVHAREALCSSRPKWSRRGFIAMFGAGIAGAALAGSFLPIAPSLPEYHEGTRARDAYGNEFIYMGWRIGHVVSFSGKRIGVAKDTVAAGGHGWLQIYGIYGTSMLSYPARTPRGELLGWGAA